MSNTDNDTTKEAGSGPLTGRELDLAVALKMGLKASFHYLENWPYCDCKELMFETSDGFEVVPDYSTDWRVTGELIELAENKYSTAFELTNGVNKKWRASFHGCLDSYRGEADTATHAVNLAFLEISEDELSKGRED